MNEGTLQLEPVAPVIVFERVGRCYARGNEQVAALEDVSARFFPGEFVAVCGPSGSGKSTLLGIAALADEPSSGRLLFEGVELPRGNEAARRVRRAARVGFVFQFFNLLPSLSARENAMLPLLLNGIPAAEAEPRARAALVELGLGARLDHYPHELSGGEMQRVAIARAVVHAPAVVAADEPTGSLDSIAGDAVAELLRELSRRGALILAATHSDHFAARCTRHVRLRDGRVESDSGERR